jgi:hypothetical protein
MNKTVIAFLLVFCGPAVAHDHERPELNSWFNTLKSEKGPCCSFHEGVAVADPDWESHNGHYRVRVQRYNDSGEMIWVDVPDEAVIKEPNLAGRTWVWPIRPAFGGVAIRCFMPGTMM